jgi:hypothetical protein
MSDITTLSPAQAERMERLEARHPGTRFEVLDIDPYSCRVIVEAEDLAGFAHFQITATGRAVPCETF